MAPKTEQKKIKSGVFSRGFALAKLTATAGAKAAGHVAGNIFADKIQKSERFKKLLIDQTKMLTAELGQLKGSVMKVGQSLSMIGEHFLPKEANDFLKSLQSQAPPLAWAEMEKVIIKELGQEKYDELEIEKTSVASASLGQVHRARIKSEGEAGRWFAMKIQYPGVDRAIDGDLKALRSILSVSKLLPMDNDKMDELFDEVREMLHQEVDYTKERKKHLFFKEQLKNDHRYVVADVMDRYCSQRILTTSFEEGVQVDGPEVRALSQERRNAIGKALVQLYFRELFEWGKIQTDAHMGNYRLRVGKDGAPDQLVLLDFGATRELDQKFLDPYTTMVSGSCIEDENKVLEGGKGLNFLFDDDTPEVKKAFAELCYLFAEPFLDPKSPRAAKHLLDDDGAYQFKSSDLPKRLTKEGSQLALKMKMRPPPREVIFIDRKLGGIFVILAVLDIRLRGIDLLRPHLR